MHTHLSGQSGDYYTDLFRRSPIDNAVRAPTYAFHTLQTGFTTVRDVGAGEYIDVSLRDAINDGSIPGPRMRVATLPISATGGHGDLNGFSPRVKIEGPSNLADGVDEIRKKVRENVKRGADLIKVLAGAGVLSEEESAGAPQYSQAELNALVEEATMWGRKVAAHAHGAEAIDRAVKAGVASVEHGGLVTEDTAKLMVKKGTFLVPDILTDVYILEHADELGLPPKIVDMRIASAGGIPTCRTSSTNCFAFSPCGNRPASVPKASFTPILNARDQFASWLRRSSRSLSMIFGGNPSSVPCSRM